MVRRHARFSERLRKYEIIRPASVGGSNRQRLCQMICSRIWSQSDVFRNGFAAR